MKRILPIVLSAVLVLAGCGMQKLPEEPTQGTIPSVGELPPAPTVDADFAQTDSAMFSDKDFQAQYIENQSAVVQFNGSSVTTNTTAVSVSGTTATLRREGTYILRGDLDNGMVIVDADDSDKIRIVLDGVNLTSATSAPLYVKNADKVFVILAEGKQNTLANGGSFTPVDENNINAALYSRQDLTILGTGSLTVTSPAGHGISCKDDLALTGGSITIHSASHGVDANDSIRIRGVALTVDAGKDGIHAENAEDTSLGFVYLSDGNLNIESEGDGISGSSFVQIMNGTIKVLAGGGYQNGESHSSGGYGDFMGGGMGPGGMGGRPRSASNVTTAAEDTSTSMKAVKGGTAVLIAGGTLSLDSADDGIHSDGTTMINGGTVSIASGDDGIHAETVLSITAGKVDITNCYEGLEAENILIDGGDISLIATDDGLNAAGGMDASAEGGRDEMFATPEGRPPKPMQGGPGGQGGVGGSSNGSIIINGGTLYVQASGDGMDANGYLKITGGYTVVCGPNRGDTATLDYDSAAIITGGTFIGTGASGMAQTFSANEQGVLSIRADGQRADVTVTVTDGQGKQIISYQPKLDFSVLIVSSPEIVSGETYHVSIDDAQGDIMAD